MASQTLYVGNLPYSTTDDQLKELFGQHGTVNSASVIIDRFSGRSRGFGFVEMGSEEDAKKALEATNGYEMDGRALKVSIARPREEKKGGFGEDRGA
ncbi:MAG: RNA-binding protein [Patescibacteria group bacterium]